MAGVLLALAALVVALGAWLYPNILNRPSTVEERAPYIAKIDSMCQNTAQQINGLGVAPVTDTQAYGQYTLAAAEILDSLVQNWSNHPPPERDIPVLRPVLDKLEERAFAARVAGQALSIGDAEAGNLGIGEFRKATNEYRQGSRAYGFLVCPFI